MTLVGAQPAASMVEAGKQFRRVDGHLHLRSLRDTLEKVTGTVDSTVHHGPSRQLMITSRRRGSTEPGTSSRETDAACPAKE